MHNYNVSIYCCLGTYCPPHGNVNNSVNYTNIHAVYNYSKADTQLLFSCVDGYKLNTNSGPTVCDPQTRVWTPVLTCIGKFILVSSIKSNILPAV